MFEPPYPPSEGGQTESYYVVYFFAGWMSAELFVLCDGEIGICEEFDLGRDYQSDFIC